MQIIPRGSSKYSIEVCLQCFGDTKGRAIKLGNGKFLRGSIWRDLTKDLMFHWENDIPGRGNSLWKSRGMKANDTVREPRAIPHSQTRGDEERLVLLGDKQGEFNQGQIIKGLVYFPKSLVFICSPFVFTMLNNTAEKQKGTIRKFHCF